MATLTQHLCRGLATVLVGCLMTLLLLPQWARAQDSVCARVKLEIAQSLTLERQAFDAHMRINNGLDNLALQQVRVDVTFTDANGNGVRATSDPNNTTALFFIRLDTMSGINDVAGNGTVPPASSADVHWLIIPTRGAGGQVPSGTLYYVGATLRYTLAGETEEMEIVPDFIVVKPLPLLTLDYFLTRDVYADDPFTAAIEPAEPFTLGLRARNNGQGVAHNVAIDSAQPRIVENEQGLLINFQILGSVVNDQPATPSLLAQLGTIAPQASSVARWQMVTSLSGKFIEFSAIFSHADELGGALTSILEATHTHSLVRDVLVDLPGRDSVRDFLALDGHVLRVYESSGLDTVVTDQSGQATFQRTSQQGTQARYALSAPATAGLLYVQVPDPSQGTRRIVSAVRTDGKVIALENVWLSKTRQQGNPWNHFINLFDANSPGQYTVTLGDASPGARPPVLQFIPDRSTAEGNRIGFLVQASDPDGTTPIVTAAPQPPGASLRNEGNGTAAFDWAPVLGQAGVYPIVFKASDGGLETAQTVRITVCPRQDTDCDGMDDAWEWRYFGTLARDGRDDFDHDGISDLDEFLRGTDPTVSESVRTFTLVAGLNVFAYPSTSTSAPVTCRGLLTTMGTTTEVESLQRFNTATQRFETCDRAGGQGFPVVASEGYMVQMLTDKALRLVSNATCRSVALNAGLNLIGLPSPPADLTCFGLLSALGEQTVASIQRFNTTTGRYEHCVYANLGSSSARPVGNDFPVVSGEGYMVYAKSSAVMSLPGCSN